MADPQKYRDDAAGLRRVAEKTQSPVIKRQMLQIADQYDRLAESLEKIKSRHKS
jgi:hypothetical protein